MGLFGPGRKQHSVGVVYIYQDLAPKKAFDPYYTALCDCGWTADVMAVSYPNKEAEAAVIAAALKHDPAADTSVEFLLERPPGTGSH